MICNLCNKDKDTIYTKKVFENGENRFSMDICLEIIFQILQHNFSTKGAQKTLDELKFYEKQKNL